MQLTFESLRGDRNRQYRHQTVPTDARLVPVVTVVAQGSWEAQPRRWQKW